MEPDNTNPTLLCIPVRGVPIYATHAGNEVLQRRVIEILQISLAALEPPQPE